MKTTRTKQRFACVMATLFSVVAMLPLGAQETRADKKCGKKCMEQGIEHGVSAAFGGMSGGWIVRAGGCNFPEDPLGKDSKKRYYQGIYILRQGASDDAWKRVGNLPAAMAYGASATTPDGVVMIGGTTVDSGMKEVLRVRVEAGCKVTVDTLPMLPFVIDNMAACVLDNRVYVAGGNVEGTPANELLCLDLDCQEAGWMRLGDFPGNPRVQPVLASSGHKLYLWGGFAGKGPGREASLETDGYVYHPSTGEWQPVCGPTDKQGTPVSTGGGIAVTLSDGRIAVAGGVNKDIFLGALRAQPADYLEHPIPWYRFNRDILVYNPRTQKWTVEATDEAYARAGAAAAVEGDRFYLFGGELKPRIRTPKTAVVVLDSK